MPGIHVRTAGEFNWVQQREALALTVPGSYWLCHKRNIYKFIFRYHRSMRNLKEFCYGKELMKIIRKIIKYPPPQGQQFETQNLLVSYNHTSWTRQDKMFAMLKFKERTNATAFSHAFILTVTVIGPSEVTESKSIPEAIIHEENSVPENRSLDKKVKRKTENESNNSDTSSNILPAGDTHFRSKETNESVDSKSENAHTDNDSVEKVLANEEKPTYSTQADGLNNSPSKTCTQLQTSETRNSGNKSNTLKTIKKRGKGTTENEKLSVDDESGERKAKMPKLSLESNPSTSNEHNDCIIDEIATDSVNLPYQYLIEKEIEDAKNKPETSQTFHSSKRSVRNDGENQGPNEHRQQKSVSPSKKNEPEVDAKVRETFNTKSNKCERWKVKSSRTLASNNNITRSSDITDLVMEGLMFTIKQGQDSVAVIEQKTKVEIDEVLENSEKVETKEGEKCLRNSSLLGLENLITMIDMPELPDKQKKNFLTISNNISDFRSYTAVGPLNQMEDNDPKSNDCLEDAVNSKQHKCNASEIRDDQCFNARLSTSPSVNNSYAEDCADDVTLILDEDSDDIKETDVNIEAETRKDTNYLRHVDDKQSAEESDEDIIPEVMQGTQSQSLFRENEKHTAISNFEVDSDSDEDLLMDDLDTEKMSESSNDDSSINEEADIFSMESEFAYQKSNTTKRESNTPRIISNEIITIDQMPLALQKALKNKLTRQNVSNEKIEVSPNRGKTSTESMNEEHSESESEMQNESENCNTIDVAFDSIKINDCNSSNKSVTTKTLESEAQEDDEVNTKKSSKELELQNNPCTSKQVRSKSHDSVHGTDQNLSSTEKERNYTETRCLRPKKKPSITANNEKDNQIQVEMLKLIHDITRGAKVVVQRISTKNISRVIEKSSSLTTCLN